MKNVQRMLSLLLVLALLWTSLPASFAQEAFETLQKGSKGDNVLQMKRRLRELGYFSTDDLNDEYNNYAVKAVKQFQTRNGLEADGVFTQAVYDALYAADAIGANDPTPSPTPVPTPDPNALFETLQKGSKGDNVLQMKRRLRELGYFSTDNLSDAFNDATVKALKQFQQHNGVEADGVFAEKVAALLYSDKAYPAHAATPIPTPKPTPTVDYPERDAEGYLVGEGEFVYENDEDGMWVYLTDSLQIIITHREDVTVPLEWFETEIFMRDGERFMSVETNPNRPGTRFKYPFDIAVENQFVLGFTDDFYGHRINRKEKVGIVIRDGEVISDSTYVKQLHNLPNLDMLAQFPDGALKAYGSADITAEELMDMGVVNVFCFGPVLISEGEISPLLEWYKTLSPRQALGMIEPGHYLLLSVLGRMKTSIGCGLPLMADMMKERGVVEALNLDGGNTLAIIFRGRMLNKLATWENKKFVRTVTSLIGVGKSESVTTAVKGE